jgi:hypothetical protein
MGANNKSSEEEVVSSNTAGSTGSKRPLVIGLAVVGVVLIILAVLYFAGVGMGPLDSIGHSGKANHGSHTIRGGITAVVGIVALAGAWWANKKSS